MVNTATALNKAREIFSEEDIPSQPAVLQQIEKELRREYADFSIVSRLISNDVSLSAATLLMVNSAFFGLNKKVSSIRHAVSILGITNIVNLVKSIALRNAMGGANTPFLEEFWRTSSAVAVIGAFIARSFTQIAADDAYTLGLFHNVGLPLMAKKFENFEIKYSLGLRIKFKSVTDIETANYGTSHSAVGALLATTWQLPELFCNVILNHHDIAAALDNPDQEDDFKTMLAVLKTAEYMCYMNHENFRFANISEWPLHQDRLLTLLGMEAETMEKVSASVHNLLREYAHMT